MPYAYVIGLASFVPGLGLWLIGHQRRAYIFGGLIAALLLISLLAPWRSARGLTFALAYLIWLGQIGIAVRSARALTASPRLKRAGLHDVAGSDQADRVELRDEPDAVHLAKEIARSQISPDERVLKVFIGNGNRFHQDNGLPVEGENARTPAGWDCVAMTPGELMVITLDEQWKPIHANRVPLREIRWAKYEAGQVADRLELAWRTGEVFSWDVSPDFRRQSSAIHAVVRGLVG